MANRILRTVGTDDLAETVFGKFLELVRSEDSAANKIDELTDLPLLLLEACRRYNFTKPFELKGEKRYFRPYLIKRGFGFDEHWAFDGPISGEHFSPVVEQAYRRG